MVDQDFIDKLSASLSSFETKQDVASLFGVFKMDDLTNKWTVVLAASWFKAELFTDVFTCLRTELLENLGDDMTSIARFGIFDEKEHLVELIQDKFKSGDYIKEPQAINGNFIHEGYIIKSERSAA